jgi:hypothetical protein
MRQSKKGTQPHWGDDSRTMKKMALLQEIKQSGLIVTETIAAFRASSGKTDARISLIHKSKSIYRTPQNMSTFTALVFILCGFCPVVDSQVVISGTVKDSCAVAIADAAVQAIDPANQQIKASVVTDSTGYYSVSVAAGACNFKVIPPPASQVAVAIDTGRVVSGNTTIDFVLLPEGSLLLRGTVSDAQGNGLANVTVDISGNSIWSSSFTDANGQYVLHVPPDNYSLNLSGTNAIGAISLPAQYQLATSTPITIKNDLVLDAVLRAVKVRVHAQDNAGNPCADVIVGVSGGGNTNLKWGGRPASGSSSYPDNGANTITDNAGNAELWLFPTDRYSKYVFTAIPPSSSQKVTASLNNIGFANDTAVTIVVPHTLPVSSTVSDEPQKYSRVAAKKSPVLKSNSTDPIDSAPPIKPAQNVRLKYRTIPGILVAVGTMSAVASGYFFYKGSVLRREYKSVRSTKIEDFNDAYSLYSNKYIGGGICGGVSAVLLSVSISMLVHRTTPDTPVSLTVCPGMAALTYSF